MRILVAGGAGFIGSTFVRRRLAAQTEVRGRADEAAAEMVLPQPIDHHPGEERVVAVGQPASQLEPATP